LIVADRKVHRRFCEPATLWLRTSDGPHPFHHGTGSLIEAEAQPRRAECVSDLLTEAEKKAAEAKTENATAKETAFSK
jgi:hypothetical protein